MPDLPKPQPVATIQNATWVAGGASATSGTAAASDYAYYTQTMEIDYVRKPVFLDCWNNDSSAGVSLWEFSSFAPVMGSELHFNIKTKNVCKKIHQAPAGGAYTQAQIIDIYAVSSDQYGFSYGAMPLDGSSDYLFGPRGKIYTSQPWIWQVVWDDTRDVEYNFITQGTSRGCYNPSSYVFDVGNNISDPYEWYIPAWFGDCNPFRCPPRISTRCTWNQDHFSMPSKYKTTSEPGYANNALGLITLINFVETWVDCLKDSNYSNRPAVPLPLNSNGQKWVVEADRVPVNPYYTTHRHTY